MTNFSINAFLGGFNTGLASRRQRLAERDYERQVKDHERALRKQEEQERRARHLDYAKAWDLEAYHSGKSYKEFMQTESGRMSAQRMLRSDDVLAEQFAGYGGYRFDEFEPVGDDSGDFYVRMLDEHDQSVYVTEKRKAESDGDARRRVTADDAVAMMVGSAARSGYPMAEVLAGMGVDVRDPVEVERALGQPAANIVGVANDDGTYTSAADYKSATYGFKTGDDIGQRVSTSDPLRGGEIDDPDSILDVKLPAITGVRPPNNQSVSAEVREAVARMRDARMSESDAFQELKATFAQSADLPSDVSQSLSLVVQDVYYGGLSRPRQQNNNALVAAVRDFKAQGLSAQETLAEMDRQFEALGLGDTKSTQAVRQQYADVISSVYSQGPSTSVPSGVSLGSLADLTQNSLGGSVDLVAKGLIDAKAPGLRQVGIERPQVPSQPTFASAVAQAVYDLTPPLPDELTENGNLNRALDTGADNLPSVSDDFSLLPERKSTPRNRRAIQTSQQQDEPVASQRSSRNPRGARGGKTKHVAKTESRPVPPKVKETADLRAEKEISSAAGKPDGEVKLVEDNLIRFDRIPVDRRLNRRELTAAVLLHNYGLIDDKSISYIMQTGHRPADDEMRQWITEKRQYQQYIDRIGGSTKAKSDKAARDTFDTLIGDVANLAAGMISQSDSLTHRLGDEVDHVDYAASVARTAVAVQPFAAYVFQQRPDSFANYLGRFLASYQEAYTHWWNKDRAARNTVVSQFESFLLKEIQKDTQNNQILEQYAQQQQ